MPSDKRKISKAVKIILSAVGIFSAVAALTLFITNFFIPVKYLNAYFAPKDLKENGQMRVTFLDVGYGNCTVVEFPDGKNMLIDGGDGNYPTNAKVFKSLVSRGINNIDYLVSTSVAPETCGGLDEVINYFEVGEIILPYCPVTYINERYRSFTDAVKSTGKTPLYCQYGTYIKGDNYKFCVLSPSPFGTGGETDKMLEEPTLYNINNASAVIWLECGGVGFLLAGNVNEYVEYKLCDMCSLGVDIDGEIIDVSECAVLKVPNYGAKTAVCAKLYEVFDPETCILSVGENNGLALPSVDAVALAQSYVGDKLYRTDYNGDITVTVADGKYSVAKEKE